MTTPMIRTPDHRLRVFISSTLQELADERRAVRDAVRRLRLAPVMFEAGARPHPPRDLYRSYLAQSHIFVGIYWQSYGWVAPDEAISGLEDEYQLSGDLPKLIYVKTPAPDRQPRLGELLARIQDDDRASYRKFSTADELCELVENDLAVLLTERFEQTALAVPQQLPPVSPEPPPRVGRTTCAIPQPLTPFVGRDRVIADVLSLLNISDVRLLTLSGPGGIGKSRVAAEVASRLGADIHWVELSGLADPALVAPTLRRSLGIDADHEADPADTLIDALASWERPLTLVLDGFEHVAGAASLVARLVDECPDLRVLVTSREVLNLRAEFEYPVPPLDTGAAAEGQQPRSEAVQLFLDIAAAVAPMLTVTEVELRAVEQICRRLEGLPLAIELAAARSRTLPPSAMLERLTDRLGFLTGGPADAPERQRTLRATLAWDYDLLDDPERMLFRRIGVAVDCCSFELAEHLAAAAGGWAADALDIVDSLARKSLLRPTEDATDPRFVMLDTVREYALDRLAVEQETDVTRDAHAEFFAAELERAVFEGPQARQSIEQIDRDRNNLRAALDWAAESGQVDLELRLCAGLADYWEMHGELVEGGARLDHAVAVSEGRQDALRLKVLGRSSHMARARGDYRRGARLAEQVLELATLLNDRRGIAHSHSDIAACAAELLDLDKAEREFRAALDAWIALGDPMRIASMHNNLAVVAELRGDLAAAEHGYLQALPVYLEQRDQTLLARCLTNLGRTLLLRDAETPALRLLTRALAHWRHLENPWDLVDCLESYGPALGRAGMPEPGLRAMAVADAVRRRISAARAPYLQPGYDAQLAQLRAAIPAEQYAATWASAAALDPAEGVAEALAVAPDPSLLAVPDWDVDTALVQSPLAELRVGS